MDQTCSPRGGRWPREEGGVSLTCWGGSRISKVRQRAAALKEGWLGGGGSSPAAQDAHAFGIIFYQKKGRRINAEADYRVNGKKI
jgi:hypothetical protein